MDVLAFILALTKAKQNPLVQELNHDVQELNHGIKSGDEADSNYHLGF